MSYILTKSLKPLPITFRQLIIDDVINTRPYEFELEDRQAESEYLYPELGEGPYVTKPIQWTKEENDDLNRRARIQAGLTEKPTHKYRRR